MRAPVLIHSVIFFLTNHIMALQTRLQPSNSLLLSGTGVSILKALCRDEGPCLLECSQSAKDLKSWRIISFIRNNYLRTAWNIPTNERGLHRVGMILPSWPRRGRPPTLDEYELCKNLQSATVLPMLFQQITLLAI